MARVSIGQSWEHFDIPLIMYRRRMNSILNTKNNSSRKAGHTTEFANEFFKSDNENLLEDNYSKYFSIIFARVEYLYVPKNKRVNHIFPIRDMTMIQRMIARTLGFLEKATQFWFFYELFAKKNYFK